MVMQPGELRMALKNDSPVFVDVIVNRRALSIPLSIGTESRPVSVFKWSSATKRSWRRGNRFGEDESLSLNTVNRQSDELSKLSTEWLPKSAVGLYPMVKN
jgi:hypothetical protein